MYSRNDITIYYIYIIMPLDCEALLTFNLKPDTRLNNIQCKELINLNNLQILKNSKYLINNDEFKETIQIQKYLNIQTMNKGIVKYLINKKNSKKLYNRLNVENGRGGQFMRRIIRNTLYRTDDNNDFTTDDLDMVNSCSVILLNILENHKEEIENTCYARIRALEEQKSNLRPTQKTNRDKLEEDIEFYENVKDDEFKRLKKYINERENILKKMMDNYNITRDTAKKFFNMNENGGTYERWLEQNKINDIKEEKLIRKFLKIV